MDGFSSNAVNKNHTTGNNPKDKDMRSRHHLAFHSLVGEKNVTTFTLLKIKNPNTQIRIREKTTKLFLYQQQRQSATSKQIARLHCFGYQSSYKGKTDRTLFT